jgi:hemolysin III
MTAGDQAHSGPDPLDAARDAADVAGERIGSAKDAAGRGISTARARATDAAEAAAKAIPKPRWRGVSHQWAFFVSLLAGAVLVLIADGSEARISAAIYAFSLSALLGVSALYHRVDWRPAVRRWMRRLDHTMIFVLIAGTYTPFAVLVLHGTLSKVILIAVWATAAAGVVLNLVWWNAPKPVTAAVYLSTGWIAVAAFPQLWESLGPIGFGLLALGGALYTAGALVYAFKRPDPRPEVFGYHEIFHLLVIAAAACQFAVVAAYALPAG